MFRYIALAWHPSHAVPDALAHRLGQGVRCRLGWCQAFEAPGLQVFSAGHRAGENGLLPIPGGNGVVLGRLFRRFANEQPGCPEALQAFDEPEATRILQTNGRALVDRHWGRYVAFLRKGDGFRVLRDPSGALPCFRLTYKGVEIVFSWLEDVLSCLPGIARPTVDLEAVAVHLGHGRSSGRATALRDIDRVLPGEAVTLAPARDKCDELWWDAAACARSSNLPAPEPRLLRCTVRACVQAWAGGGSPLLLRLSGGVDSSIVLSCLDPASTSTDVTCVNYRSPGEGGDETAYARAMAERARRTLIERERDTGLDLNTLLEVACTPDPCGLVGRIGTAQQDAALATKLGATRLFTGAGGDQLFFEVPCTWPASDYACTRGIDGGLWPALLDSARLARVSVWVALRAAIAERLRPSDPWPPADKAPPLMNAEAWFAHPQRDRFVHPALAAGHGLPIGKASQLLQLLQPTDYYDPLLRDAAPEVVNPLLSQPIIELCLATPLAELTRGGTGRALARQAFRDDLPSQVRFRTTKGGMGDHLRLLLKHNRSTVRALLNEGELARHRLLDRQALERATSALAPDDADLFSTFQCLGIEAWLRRLAVVSADRSEHQAESPSGAA